MKRNDIKGFTVRILGYSIEVVTIKYILREIAIYKKNNINLVRRFEW